MMRVGVYGSARNEEANLEAWLDSCADADVIAINDTGSTDRTFPMAEADPRIIASQLPVEPMLLSNALNIALGQLPDDVDLAIRLDLDERLQPGWRAAIEAAWTPQLGPVVLRPWFDHHGLIYLHDRCHSRHGFHWDLPVHEVLLGDGPRIPVEFTIKHLQDITGERANRAANNTVLAELQTAHDNDPTNLRMLHYYGRELTYHRRWADAITLLHKHATSDAYNDERGESWLLLGDCYLALLPLEHVNHEPWRQAMSLRPGQREPWVKAADLHHRTGRWHSARYCAREALKITGRHAYLNHPWAWNGFPYHLHALASWYLDEQREALEHGQRAVELDPHNDLYRANLAWYEGALTTVG